ncbi:MAG: leucine-rich repeat protein [Bacteroidaceae bacterium]|nr:leucine-rich repeat protein [Bacteroidaceae bacterium]
MKCSTTSKRGLLIFVLLSTFIGLRAYDVEVDGICYDVVKLARMAVVTHRGSGVVPEPNSYAGEVVVPEHITYNGRTYVVRSVSQNAFADCEELVSVKLPSTLTAVSSCAFLGCPKLKEVSVPQSLLAVGSCAFTGCTSLKSMILPRKAECVDTLTFYCCASLTSLILPHRIQTICEGALEHIPSMTNLYCYASVPPVAEQGSFTLRDQQKCTLHVPKASIPLYLEALGWKDFHQIVALKDEEYISQNYQKGDINDDGRVDAADLALLQRIIVSLPDDSSVHWAADVNADGKVNSIDFVKLRNQVAQ